MAQRIHTIEEASRALSAGEVTSVSLAKEALDAIKENEPSIGAYLEVFDDVLAQAEAADARRKAGENITPLLGVPIAIKDNLLLKGRKASAASKILEGYIAPYTATAVQKLLDAGAVVIGRTNMDEFAMGSSTENSGYAKTKNPRDTARVPGGSSGGSAASVAYGGAIAALGSDTGGSIRQPASYCGIVGLKPTYGSVSRHGLMAMGSSLDIIGPLTNSVKDAQILFDAMRGNDPMDSTSLPDYAHTNAPKQMKIGIPRAFVGEGIDPDVQDTFTKALQSLEKMGHQIVDISLPHISYSLPAYYVIMPAEASSNLARFDGVKYGLLKEGRDRVGDTKQSRTLGFGAEVKRRIMLGSYVLSAGYYDAFYGKATSVRNVIKDELIEAFKGVDVIATPTAPSPAFKSGEKSDPVSMYLADIFTVSANIAGVPALSVPMGDVQREGIALPVGIQFIASPKNESVLFEIGTQFERRAD